MGRERGIETERKFIIGSVPKGLSRFRNYEITQAYLKITPTGEVRVRRSGKDGCTLTSKSGRGLSRVEDTEPIDRGQFERLMQKNTGRVIEKTRYEIPYMGCTIELDVYKGELSGLVIAEVEFKDATESSKFVPPRWFGREVTTEERYKNKSLSKYGLPA